MECYSATRKEWNDAICSNMDGSRDYYSKWSKSEGERQISWYHLYVEFKIWYGLIYKIDSQT